MDHPIFSKIEHAAKPDFGNILSKSFDLFKNVFVEAAKHAGVSLLIMIPFMLVIYIPLMPMYIEMIQNAGDPYYTPTAFEDYEAIMIVGWVFLVFILSFLLQPLILSLTAHFYKVCQNADMGTQEPVGGYFDLAKQQYGKLLVLSLATTGIALLAMVLCYLPLFYAIVPLQLTLPILFFNDKLSVGEILRASFKLGNKFWLIAFGLIFLSSFISMLGMILCFIGVIITAYFQHVVMYYFYKDTVGFADNPATEF